MMKTLNEYLKLPYRMELVKDQEEGGYVVSFPDLPGCVTGGDDMAEAVFMAEDAASGWVLTELEDGNKVPEAVANAEDARKVWLTAAIEDGLPIPEPDELDDYSGQFKLRIPKSLHRSLAEHSKREGISMNQYCLYLLSKNDAVYNK